MIVPGCLAVLVLPVAGALLGHWWGGTQDAMLGAGIGLVIGFMLFCAMIWAIRHIKKG